MFELNRINPYIFVLIWLYAGVAAVAGQDLPATQAREGQPDWITPLATVTPLLEQEYRFDLTLAAEAGGVVANYGAGKGLEFISSRRTEVIVGVPGWLAGRGGASGFGDTSFLFKCRLAARPAAAGNYVVTAFLGASVPSGTQGVTSAVAALRPAIAAGKGWGRFDVQTTLGLAAPLRETGRVGVPLAWNTALQYRVRRHLWPELEWNPTVWLAGPHRGRTQLYLTPGLVLGGLPLRGPLKLTAGLGEQIAVTRFHGAARAWIFSLRLPF